MEKTSKWLKWINLGSILFFTCISVYWLNAKAIPFCLRHLINFTTNLSVPSCICIISVPVIYKIAWLNACISSHTSHRDDYDLKKMFRNTYIRIFIIFLVGYCLAFLIGIGFIWLLGWTYGFIFASLVLLIVNGGFFGLLAMSVLPFLYKLLLG